MKVLPRSDYGIVGIDSEASAKPPTIVWNKVPTINRNGLPAMPRNTHQTVFLKNGAISLLPDNLSDETATALCDVLHDLAFVCDSRYLAQILRYREGQRFVSAPKRPWRSPPPDP